LTYIKNLKVPLTRFLGYVRGTKGHGFPITGIIKVKHKFRSLLS